MIRVRSLSILLVLCFALTSCTNDLQTVAKALDDTSHALGVIQTAVIQANSGTPKLLSDAQTKQILGLTLKVGQAGLDATNAIRGLNSLAPADRTKLLAILQPIVAAVNDALNQNILAGVDQKTQDTIKASVLVVQAALNTAIIAINGGS
jgi:hypothetical protein